MYTVEAPPAQVENSSMPQAKESLLHNLAHELRQPLSTLESIAYYLELALPQADARVLEQVKKMRELVVQSGWMLSDALLLSDRAGTTPAVVDIDELVSEFVIEQGHHELNRHFALELAGAPVNVDFAQARELVSAVGRLMLNLSKVGGTITVATLVLPDGPVALRARTEAAAQDGWVLPAGAQLTVDAIAKLVAQNSGKFETRLGEASLLEVAVELPAATQEREDLASVAAVVPAFAEDETLEPVAPNTP